MAHNPVTDRVVPYTSNETFKHPGKHDKCSWHQCKFFCFTITFLPFLVSPSSCFQEQSALETNSQVNMRYKKNQPSMTSPFAKCWGQTATKRSLEKYSGVTSTSGWFLMVPFWTDFQACNMADHLFGPLLFQHQSSSFREHGFRGGNNSPQPLQVVFSC